jgi:hypothetical protein
MAALCPYQALGEGVSDADAAGALVWGREKVSMSVILATQLEILLKRNIFHQILRSHVNSIHTIFQKKLY